MLAGGVGGARFLLGLRAAAPEARISVVGNTGDDVTLFGLRICPDLDTLMYTLGGGIDSDRGWGRTDESFTVRAELAAYGDARTWFGLGDRDLSTHLLRTEWLGHGIGLAEVTRRLCGRWQPGVELLPMTEAPVETHVALADGRRVHFQEWWIRLRAEIPATAFTLRGADAAVPAPGVLAALEAADLVLLPPSNPVVSIGTILTVPGIRDAVAAKPVVGLSPIVGGAPVRGMADACLAAIGVATTAQAVGRHYGADLLDGWLVDSVDADAQVPDVAVRAVPLLMHDLAATTAMARAALDLAAELTAGAGARRAR